MSQNLSQKRKILIVGGGTAGWMTAAYLARFLEIKDHDTIDICLLESPDIGIIGVGEGTFPTIRNSLKFIGIEEADFLKATQATFKQGIRFIDWRTAPENGQSQSYFHPFEPPYYTEGAGLVPYWLLQDEATRRPFAEAVSFQKRVAEAKLAPKRAQDEAFGGPLNYAYHFDAVKLAKLLSDRAQALGVHHISDTLLEALTSDDGQIKGVRTQDHGVLSADLYIDCSGFRAELIGRALKVPFVSAKPTLLTDSAISVKIPYRRKDTPLESYTLATAHEAGWIWDIGLSEVKGLGFVYGRDYMSQDQAIERFETYLGRSLEGLEPRFHSFEAGYRQTPWVKNCVAVGLAGGFLEPLESTGVLLIEVAMGMIADLFPHNGPMEAPAQRFNHLMQERFSAIIRFLKLHYCLSERPEPFWRDNRDPDTIPDPLKYWLEQWKYRPPARFDFLIDVESFAYFNYQYILYGMGFKTDLSQRRGAFPHVEAATKIFEKIKGFGVRASHDLPSHRELISKIRQGQ